MPENARIGVVLDCEVRGEMVVTGFSDAPIRWIVGRPWRRGVVADGKPSLIVVGGLASAIRLESAKAVAWWFGATRRQVAAWRKSLGVSRRGAK